MAAIQLNEVLNLLKRHRFALSVQVARFQDSHLIEAVRVPVLPERDLDLRIEDTVWAASCATEDVADRPDAVRLRVTFRLTKGNLAGANVGLCLTRTNWSVDNYVLMPAAVYKGNRFESRSFCYPPQLKDPQDIGPYVPTIISDVPRLEKHAGASKIQLMTRDLSTPAIGFHDPGLRAGFFLLTGQGTHLGDSGIGIEESDDRSQATIAVTAPGVRQEYMYRICTTRHPCEDRGADFREGDSITVETILYFFDCPSVASLFDYFVAIRKDMTGPVKLHHQMPFHSAWVIQEDKYNRENWVEQHGYYSVGSRDSKYSFWQVGWVGGMMVTYPFLLEGTDVSRARALENFDFVFPEGQGGSGFFHGCGDGEKWYGDRFDEPFSRKWHLIRKSADALYYIIKQFMLFRKQRVPAEVPEAWASGTKRCADAFVRLWDRWGQFGQFVDVETGDIIVGGSTSAGIAPAGLALAWQYFGNEDYLRVARAGASHMYENYVAAGITTGGPGEACQCPDSESAFGLLESFVVLYEVTGEARWVEMARDTANQCSTWCVSYDFEFPPDSTFGLLDMRTVGTVYANAQNKHSAPGICTHSGVSLFKLFRATGDVRYLELLQEIAHSLPQYLSRADRPIGGMPPGWMNERVEMSDWLEPIGEIFYGSCWCEVSNMLTYAEVPGLYVQPDTAFLCAIDHIDAEVAEENPEKLVVKVTNPTKFRAVVKVFSENSTQMSQILGQNALWGCRRVVIDPESSQDVPFRKSPFENPLTVRR